MTSERPYRQSNSVMSVCQELVRLAPAKFDSSVVQALLVHLRRDLEGKSATRLLPHWVPDMGTRLTTDGSTLAYTGDTGPSENIAALARDVDTLVAEASWNERPQGIDPLHLTAREAGEHAARSGAGRLVLSHIWPGQDRDRSRELAAAAFDGDLVVADDGLGIEVGS